MRWCIGPEVFSFMRLSAPQAAMRYNKAAQWLDVLSTFPEQGRRHQRIPLAAIHVTPVPMPICFGFMPDSPPWDAVPLDATSQN